MQGSLSADELHEVHAARHLLVKVVYVVFSERKICYGSPLSGWTASKVKGIAW